MVLKGLDSPETPSIAYKRLPRTVPTFGVNIIPVPVCSRKLLKGHHTLDDRKNTKFGSNIAIKKNYYYFD